MRASRPASILANAEARVAERHARVDALLGLTGSRTSWQAAGKLADAPAAPPALDDSETAAVTASLELVRDRERVDAAHERLSDQRLRSWLPELGLGVSVLDLDYNIEVGPALRVGLPLFDWRSGPRARARAELARADHERSAMQTDLAAAARAARAAALAAHAEAIRLHDVVLPLRQQIVDETLKHYNAMDADPFQLIVARRDLVAANHQYLDALRRYANASSEIEALRRGALLEEDARDDQP